MTFALQNAKLWDHIEGSAKKPPKHKEKLYDNDNK